MNVKLVIGREERGDGFRHILVGYCGRRGKKLTISNSVGAEVGVSVVVWASTECSDLVAFTHTVLSRSIRH